MKRGSAKKGMLTRVRARRGSRPRVPRDYRYGYRDLFSAICPESGISAGHVSDRANTDEMNRHLVDIGSAVPMGRHALAVLDGAGTVRRAWRYRTTCRCCVCRRTVRN